MNHDCAMAELMASKYLTCYNPFFSLDFADRYAEQYRLSGLDADAWFESMPAHTLPGE